MSLTQQSLFKMRDVFPQLTCLYCSTAFIPSLIQVLQQELHFKHSQQRKYSLLNMLCFASIEEPRTLNCKATQPYSRE